MATAFDDLIPQRGKAPPAGAFSDLVPAQQSTLSNVFHRVVDFITNSPAQQIVDRNRAAGRPQPDAFSSVTAAVPTADGVRDLVTNPAAGAGRRAAGRGIIPSLAGAGGFGAGAALGGTLTAPAEAIPIVGTGINLLGALGGGLLGAFGASAAAGKVQDKAIAALPVGAQQAIGQDHATRLADEREHPIATFTGGLAPALFTMRPGFSSTPVAEDAPLLTRLLARPTTGAAVGATFGGGQEAAREYVSGEDFDPTKIAIATGTGALLNRPTKLGSRLFELGGNATVLGAQRAARGAGLVKEAIMGRDGTEARQPFDIEAPATPIPQERLPAPETEAAPPSGGAFADLIPASPEPVAPPAEAQPVIGAAAAGGVAGTAGGAATPPAPREENGKYVVERDDVPAFGITGRRELYGPFTTAGAALTGKAGTEQHLVTRQSMQTENGVTSIAAHEYLGADGNWYPLHDFVKLGGEASFATVQEARAEAAKQAAKKGIAPEPSAAPNALPQAAQPAEPQPLRDGEQYVRTPAGNKVRTRMEVVDASTLNKAEGDLQNRDRSRDTTTLQVQDIISKFDPELLGNDPSSDRGAPIIHGDNTVLSGNGRMLALNRIYDEHPEKADAYRRFIEAQGHSTEGVDRPVLIRRVTQDMTPEEARQFVVESNKDNKLELSQVERARSDADNVTPEMLERYAGGDLNSGANAGFVEAFTKKLTAGEMGGVIGTDRRLTTSGIDRIENAVVAKAYDHPKLLEKLMESAHNEIRAITSSLANVAPAWAKMRESAKGGALDGRYDITSDLADAAMRVAEARRAGTKPADILTQIDAFDRPSPITEKLIEAFYSPGMKRPASVKAVTGLLRDYIDEASAQQAGEGLFGEEPGKEPVDILNELLREREGGDTLFDRPLEDRAPTETNGGAYARTHEQGATTDRPSDLRSAVEHLGMKWDDFNLKAPPTQMQLLQRAIKDKLGIKVTVDHSVNGAHKGAIPYRVAIDQMLDAFHNISVMAAVLGLPEKAMSLSGTLTLHLQKKARFYGAFYPGEGKIALPGRSNSFAHEWGHALDYYLLGRFAAEDGKGLSGLIRRTGTSAVREPEIAARFASLMSSMFFDKTELATKIMALEAKVASATTEATRAQFTRQIERIKQGAGQHRTGRTQFYKNARAVDGPNQEPGNAYWQSPTEMMARAFEAYVAKKAADAGMSTEVISHADADYLSEADERLKLTYPKGEERQAIFEAFDELFDTLGHKQTLGKGEAAQIPENPARREDATPERVNAFKRIVANELGAFEDWRRSREKAADRPSDPKGFLQKANDVRHFLFSGMAAEVRALGRRWNSKAIGELHDLLVSEAGRGNRLQRRDFTMARRLRGNRYANSIEKALIDYGPRKVEGGKSHATTLSKEQAADVRGMMVNEVHIAAHPELKTLASRLREISDGIWHDLRATGFNIGYARNGHLPRIYDVPKAEADMAGFLKAAQEVYEAAGLEESEARKAAAEWYYRLVQSSPHSFDQHQPSADFLKGRALPPEADTLMADFMVNEPIDLMRRYAEAAAHRIEWAKRFGVDNNKLNKLYDRMANERVDRRDIDTIRTMLDIMAGQNPMRQKDPTLNAVGAGVNTIYGTVALLGRATFQSLAESVTSGIVLENPVYGVKALADLVSGALGSAKGAERREIADFIGLVDMTNHTRLLADRFGGSYDDPVSMQKINNKLFYNTGLIALTRAQYTHNMGVVNAYLASLSKKLLKADEGSAAKRDVLAIFNELGIRDPEPFARWMTGLEGKLPSKDEVAEGLDERGTAPQAFDWVTATRRLSERIVQDPHAMTKPRLSHSGNLGRLATGIQAFNYSFYENVLKPVFKRNWERFADGRAGIGGKALLATIAAFGVLYVGQLLTTTLRVFLTDRERWRQEEEAGTLYKYLLNRTATQFIGNPLDPLVQAATGLKYNRSLGANMSGPALGNIIANATDVASIAARNSRKTNTAEHNAINGAYRIMSPWVSAGVGSLPGGPLVSGAEGAAQSYITSPQAGQDFATAIVGPKNGRMGKDGKKIKSGPTAYDLFLDRKLGPVERKKRAEQ